MRDKLQVKTEEERIIFGSRRIYLSAKMCRNSEFQSICIYEDNRCVKIGLNGDKQLTRDNIIIERAKNVFNSIPTITTTIE